MVKSRYYRPLSSCERGNDQGKVTNLSSEIFHLTDSSKAFTLGSK